MMMANMNHNAKDLDWIQSRVRFSQVGKSTHPTNALELPAKELQNWRMTVE
jgi:hypothetical protein